MFIVPQDAFAFSKTQSKHKQRVRILLRQSCPTLQTESRASLHVSRVQSKRGVLVKLAASSLCNLPSWRNTHQKGTILFSTANISHAINGHVPGCFSGSRRPCPRRIGKFNHWERHPAQKTKHQNQQRSPDQPTYQPTNQPANQPTSQASNPPGSKSSTSWDLHKRTQKGNSAGQQVRQLSCSEAKPHDVYPENVAERWRTRGHPLLRSE